MLCDFKLSEVLFSRMPQKYVALDYLNMFLMRRFDPPYLINSEMEIQACGRPLADNQRGAVWEQIRACRLPGLPLFLRVAYLLFEA